MARFRSSFALAVFAVLASSACASSVENPPAPRSPTTTASPGAPGWIAPVRGAPARDNDEAAAPATRPEALSVLQATLDVLQKNGDPDAAAHAVIPFVHRSLLDEAGKKLSNDVRQFSFKKAHTDAGHYENPIRITRTRAGSASGLGYGAAAEKGQTVDYFIAKRDPDKGMPAPVTIFFPASGGPPKVAYLGSL